MTDPEAWRPRSGMTLGGAGSYEKYVSFGVTHPPEMISAPHPSTRSDWLNPEVDHQSKVAPI